MWTRRKFIRLTGLVGISAFLGCRPTPRAGETPPYPERPVTMVVPFAAGGALDLTARALAEATKPYFPQPIVVVNRPGGAGSVGASEVVRSKPDGYTIGITAVAVMAVQPHLTDLPYKGPEDYQPVIKVTSSPQVLATRAEVPWNTAQELLNYARANPGRLRFGTSGIGTILHLNMEILKSEAQVDLVHVPFGSDGETMTALLGGHIEVGVIFPAVAVAHAQAGRIRVLGTFGEDRHPLFPEAPTFRELGYSADIAVYQFIIVPKGTPGRVVRVLHDAFMKAIESQAFKEFAAGSGYQVDYEGPEDLRRRLARDYARFGELVSRLKLRG